MMFCLLCCFVICVVNYLVYLFWFACLEGFASYLCFCCLVLLCFVFVIYV